MNFKEIYLNYVQKFKEKIKDEHLDKLFNNSIDERIILKTKHTKNNQEPEALTSDIIKEMLRECGIDSLDINREIIISGKDKSLQKIIKKKPDFFIESSDEDLNRHLLFEIEALNKNLEKEGDGEGIEQANEWYNVRKPLFLQYNTIITNFFKWFILFYNSETEQLEVQEKKPWEMLEIIRNVRFGRGREYILKTDEQKRAITNKFYNGYRKRLDKLLKKKTDIEFEIEVINSKKPSDITQDDYEQHLIDYYRTIFSRLLFIKILKSWKMLSTDPISEVILLEQKRHWGYDLRILFFEVFNKKPKNRPKEIPEKFKDLPYLNGGLFRASGIELDEIGRIRDISLNPDAIKDIWDFFDKFKFIEDDSSDDNEKSITINPEILGYIFERSIGEERKKTGSYYTPEEITDYIIENTLYPFVIENVNKFLKNFKIMEIKSFSEIDFLENSVDVYDHILNSVLLNIKICDPACGSGAFLKKSADKLMYLYKKCYKGCGRIIPFKIKEELEGIKPFSDLYSIRQHILQNSLYGVDLNPSAVEICELRLWLWAIKPPNISSGSKFVDSCPPLPNIEYNIRPGNSLVGYVKIPKRLDKTTRIDEIAFKDMLQEKKDLITSYYKETDLKEEEELNQLRIKINDITKKYQDKLNTTLISDYQKELALDITIPSLIITDYIEDSEIKLSDLQKSISRLNTEFKLTNFKIKCKESLTLDPSDIRKRKGLTCSTRKDTTSIKTIYATSSFDIKYYSESRKEIKNRLSEFIVSLLSKEDWKNVDNIEFKRKPDQSDLKKYTPFHWFMQFTDVFEKGGFDIIVGNPPYGGNVSKVEVETNKEINISKPNIAKIFILRVEKLIRDGGYISLLAPKSLTYASDWLNLRKRILNELLEIYDIKEGFKDVLLEQIFYISKKNYSQSFYKAKDFYNDEEPIQISKDKIDDTLYCDLLTKDFEIISNIIVEQKLTDLIKTYRGLPLQQFVTEAQGQNALEGRNIKLYGLKEPYRKYDLDQKLTKSMQKKAEKLKENAEKYKTEKIVFQNIVAFISKPTHHIKVMGSYEEEGLVPTDTVNVIETKKDIDKIFILGLMNSVFFSWLLHRVAYNKAVRTMHLDNYALSKIPIPTLKENYIKEIVNSVTHILDTGFNSDDYFVIEENILSLYSLSIEKMPNDYQILLEWKKEKM